MAIIAPSYSELVEQGRQSVAQNTAITNFSDSSIVMTIIRIMANYQKSLWDQLEEAERQGNLSTATGPALDNLGSFYGVQRKGAVNATSLGGAQSVLFTNNGSQTVNIPLGTRVWTPGDIERAYFTLAFLTLGAGQQGYADIQAGRAGAFYNTAAGSITGHNAPYPLVTVTNILPVSNGSSPETDQNYRVRISNSLARREGPNETSIKQALLDIPGVRDVILLPLARGLGTADALILSYDPVPSDELLAACQGVLDQEMALGVSALARAPITVTLDVAIRLTLKPGSDPISAQTLGQNAAHGLIDNLPIEDGAGNGTLYYEDLAARVQESSPDILDSSTSITRDDLPALRANQTLLPGERFLLRATLVS